MAEIVEYKMERCLVHYELMRARKIFEEPEINNIIKKREGFEYELRKRHKSLKPFLEYIQYERTVLTAALQRKKHDTGVALEQLILQHIRDLYSEATNRFPENERLWDEYFRFCLKAKFEAAEIRSVLLQMRQFHGDKVLAWLKCIKWERSCNHTEEIKSSLLSGLARHPTSIRMYAEMLNFHLSNDSADENVAEKAIVIYRSGAKQVPTMEYHLAMMDEAMKHTNTENLVTIILAEMKEKHCNEAIFWHTIAQRELNGYETYSRRIEQADPLPLKERIKLCIEVYRKILPDINTQEMWSYYLQTLLSINKEPGLTTFKRRLLGKGYKDAEVANRMTVPHYLEYIEILEALDTDKTIMLPIIERAAKTNPDSPDICLNHMLYYVNHSNDPAKVKEIFEASTRKFGSDGLELWHNYISYLQEIDIERKTLEHVFERVTQQTHSNFDKLKGSYLKWAFELGGIKFARTIYQKILESGIPCLELHNIMAEYESIQDKPNINLWRKCLKYATEFYGTDRVDVWLKQIEFEMKYGCPIDASKLSDAAANVLKSGLLSTFRTELNSLKASTVDMQRQI